MKTILERRKIYEEVLKDILIDESYCRVGILYTGLCRMLRPNTMDDIAKFPELMRHKPSRKTTYEYWWSISSKRGINKRIEVLLCAIADTY